VLQYAPELDRQIRAHLKPTNDSWRVDETYVKIKGMWKYLYRAVDSVGNTLDFMLSAKRDGKAAARFFRKVLKSQHTRILRVITVDKNAAYPIAIEALKMDETTLAVSAKQRAEESELRQSKYLNNVIEQDHRNIKRVVKPMMGFKSFNSARRTLSGIEAMNTIRKGQVSGIELGDSVSQARFIRLYRE
jgi:transposase-like protein